MIELLNAGPVRHLPVFEVEHYESWKSDRVEVAYRRNGEQRKAIVVRPKRQNAEPIED